MIRAALCGPTPRAASAITARFPWVWTRACGAVGALRAPLLLLVLLSRPDRRDRLLVPRVQRGDARRAAVGALRLVGDAPHLCRSLPVGTVETEEDDPVVPDALADRLDHVGVGVFGNEELRPQTIGRRSPAACVRGRSRIDRPVLRPPTAPPSLRPRGRRGLPRGAPRRRRAFPPAPRAGGHRRTGLSPRGSADRTELRGDLRERELERVGVFKASSRYASNRSGSVVSNTSRKVPGPTP